MKKYNHTLHYLLVGFVILIVGFVTWSDLQIVFKKAISDLNNKDKNVGLVDVSENKIKSLDSSSEITPGPLIKENDDLKDHKLTDNFNVLYSSLVIKLTNEERNNNGGIKPLKENKILNQSAETKMRDMFDKKYFEHISPSGVGVSDLATANNYSFMLIGENLAMGNFKSSEELVKAWMNSEGHRENILNKNYTEIGVAVGLGNFNGRDVWMAVQHFGTPRSVCPTVDNVLHGKIEINRNRLDEMIKDLKDRNEKIENGGLYEGMTLYEQINEYNSLVNEYNDLIIDTKNKIENYNNQIQSFNSCISIYK